MKKIITVFIIMFILTSSSIARAGYDVTWNNFPLQVKVDNIETYSATTAMIAAGVSFTLKYDTKTTFTIYTVNDVNSPDYMKGTGTGIIYNGKSYGNNDGLIEAIYQAYINNIPVEITGTFRTYMDETKNIKGIEMLSINKVRLLKKEVVN